MSKLLRCCISTGENEEDKHTCTINSLHQTTLNKSTASVQCDESELNSLHNERTADKDVSRNNNHHQLTSGESKPDYRKICGDTTDCKPDQSQLVCEPRRKNNYRDIYGSSSSENLSNSLQNTGGSGLKHQIPKQNNYKDIYSQPDSVCIFSEQTQLNDKSSKLEFHQPNLKVNNYKEIYGQPSLDVYRGSENYSSKLTPANTTKYSDNPDQCSTFPRAEPSYTLIYGETENDYISKVPIHNVSYNEKPSHRALYGGDSGLNPVIEATNIEKPWYKNIYGVDSSASQVNFPQQQQSRDSTKGANCDLTTKPSHRDIYGGELPSQYANLIAEIHNEKESQDNKFPANNNRTTTSKPSHRGIYGGEQSSQYTNLIDDIHSVKEFQDHNKSSNTTTPKPSHRDIYGTESYSDDILENFLKSNATVVEVEDIEVKRQQKEELVEVAYSSFQKGQTKKELCSSVKNLPIAATSSNTSCIEYLPRFSRTSTGIMDRDWKKPTDFSNVNVVHPQRVNETVTDFPENEYQRGLCKILDFKEITESKVTRLIARRDEGEVSLGVNQDDNVFDDQVAGAIGGLSLNAEGYGPMSSKEVEDGTKVFTLLQSACKGDINVLKKHYHEGTDMNIADYDGRRALHLAAAEGHIQCVRFLIETCNVPHSPRDRWFHTPLDEAKSFQQAAVTKYLEDYINKVEEQEKGAKTYLLLNSACRGDLRTLTKLYQDNVDMRIADYDGRTALHLCAAEGKLDCVKFLLESCEVSHSPKDRWFQTPLDEAKNAKQTAVIDYMEEFIARANEKNAGAEVYSIMNSACKGDLSILQRMAHDGVDMQIADYDGRTALHLAAAEGHAEVVKFLVEKCKVHTAPKDRWQHTPLDEARNSKKEAVIKILERYSQPSKK